MNDTYRRILHDPTRLQILRELELVDSPVEGAFDRLTNLATKVLGVPVSLVSIVDADRQFFKSFMGLVDPWASQRQTPLSHSFCQHVVVSNEPLVIDDARQDPLVKDNLAIPDLNVIGYLGIPLTTTDGFGLGSFCVIDNKPHEWTEHEIEVVRELAQSVMTEIELRAMNKFLAYKNWRLERMTEFITSTLDHLEDITNAV